MHKNPLLDRIQSLVEPLLESIGLELWGMEFIEGGRSILRIFIEKASTNTAEPPPARDLPENEGGGIGASIGECAEGSRLIGLALEVEECMPGAYVLEVSTPGLERKFFKPAQLAACTGKMVDLLLETPLPSHPGRRRFIGTISGSAQNAGTWSYSLELPEPAPNETPVLNFGWGHLKKAQLVHVEPPKPGRPTKKNTTSPKKTKNKF